MNRRLHDRHSIRLKEYDYSQSGAYFVTIVRQDRKFAFGNIKSEEMILSPSGKIVNDCWLWLAQQYPYVELDEYIIMPDHFHGILIINRNFDSHSADWADGSESAQYRDESESAPRTGGSRSAPTTTPARSAPTTTPARSAPTTTSLDESESAQYRDESESAPRTGGSRSAPTTTASIKIKPLGQLIAAFKTVSTKQINLMQNTPGQILWQRNYYEHIIRNENDLDRIRKYIRSNPIYWNK